MDKILILTTKKETAESLLRSMAALRTRDTRVATVNLDATSAAIGKHLMTVFSGQPPEMLVADLSGASDCLPIRHLRRIIQSIWGMDMPIVPTLGLVEERHLAVPDWPAFIDDFLLAPYRTDELLARVRLIDFRIRHLQTDSTVPIADLRLDVAGRQAFDGRGRVLPLTPREYELIAFLATHKGKFFSRDQLLDLVWGVDFDGGERTIDVHMRRLRAKLPPVIAARLETRRGIGYGLNSSS